ncbi:MAG: hypothetical protein ACYC2H_12705 [Thermoplasmatota archaeon]
MVGPLESSMPVLALLLIVAMPLAAADVPVAPPMDLQASAVPEGVQLTWSAPIDASAATTYSVYVDGILVQAGIEGLSFLDTSTSSSATVYAVTAVSAVGESVPALTTFTTCIVIDPNAFPFVFVNLAECP